MGPTGTFPCHTEHLMGWKRDALEGFGQPSGEELLPTPLPGAFSALGPFPRTAPPGGRSQHCRQEQAAATRVSTGGKRGPRRASQGPQCQPSPVCVRQCPEEWFFNLGCLLSNDRCESTTRSDVTHNISTLKRGDIQVKNETV